MTVSRQTELSNLKAFLTYGDNEINTILQSLQWNQQTLINDKPMVTCTHDANHKVPNNKRKEHEERCWMKSQGYSKEEKMFPTFPDDTPMSVKLNSEDIKKIIDKSYKNNTEFKKGKSWSGPPPLTLERLQAVYTPDERRAIYDAVVASDPTCHNLSDLALLDTNDAKTEKKSKSRLEILAELRDMRRRRTKYRIAAKTKKYSDVLREVIKTQMEMYTGIHSEDSVLDKASHSHKKLHDEKESLPIEKSNSRKQKFYQENYSRNSYVNSRDVKNFATEKDSYIFKPESGTQHCEKYERTYDKHRGHGKIYDERDHWKHNKRSNGDKLRDKNKREEKPASYRKKK